MKSRGLLLLLPLLMAALAAGKITNKGWWKNTVFYQIYPRSFMDSNGDGVGDLQGVTAKLQHFVNSGIGAIWLSPINRSPMVDFGYDISDFRDIDETFGSIQDFENLLKAAKKLGLKVILDLVPNHTSDQHEWFVKSAASEGKYKDYYIWSDGKNKKQDPPNNWLSVFRGSAWKFHEKRQQYYFHQFEYRQPDLNYNNPDVRQEMEDIITFWMEKGIDGFRVDAVPHIFEDDISKDEPKSGTTDDAEDHASLDHIYTKDHPKTYDLIKSWRDLMDKYSDVHNIDEKLMMTEAYTSLKNTVKFYDYGSNIPFNFKFIMEVNAASNATDFKRIIDEWMEAKPNSGVANWVLGNHDNNRTATRFPGRGDQMTMLAMVLPGVAVTYNGEEIGMVDHTGISFKDTQDPQGCNAGEKLFRKVSRDPCRTPFQWRNAKNAGFSTGPKTWLPINSNYKQLNLENQESDPQSHYSVYKTLTGLRKTSDALKNGDLLTAVLSSNVLAVVRNSTNETVSLLINFSNNVKSKVDLSEVIDKSSSYVLIADKASKLQTNARVSLDALTIPAKSSVILLSVNGAMGILADPFKLILLLIFSQIFRL